MDPVVGSIEETSSYNDIVLEESFNLKANSKLEFEELNNLQDHHKSLLLTTESNNILLEHQDKSNHSSKSESSGIEQVAELHNIQNDPINEANSSMYSTPKNPEIDESNEDTIEELAHIQSEQINTLLESKIKYDAASFNIDEQEVIPNNDVDQLLSTSINESIAFLSKADDESDENDIDEIKDGNNIEITSKYEINETQINVQSINQQNEQVTQLTNALSQALKLVSALQNQTSTTRDIPAIHGINNADVLHSDVLSNDDNLLDIHDTNYINKNTLYDATLDESNAILTPSIRFDGNRAETISKYPTENQNEISQRSYSNEFEEGILSKSIYEDLGMEKGISNRSNMENKNLSSKKTTILNVDYLNHSIQELTPSPSTGSIKDIEYHDITKSYNSKSVEAKLMGKIKELQKDLKSTTKNLEQSKFERQQLLELNFNLDQQLKKANNQIAALEATLEQRKSKSDVSLVSESNNSLITSPQEYYHQQQFVDLFGSSSSSNVPSNTRAKFHELVERLTVTVDQNRRLQDALTEMKSLYTSALKQRDNAETRLREYISTVHNNVNKSEPTREQLVSQPEHDLYMTKIKLLQQQNEYLKQEIKETRALSKREQKMVASVFYRNFLQGD